MLTDKCCGLSPPGHQSVSGSRPFVLFNSQNSPHLSTLQPNVRLCNFSTAESLHSVLTHSRLEACALSAGCSVSRTEVRLLCFPQCLEISLVHTNVQHTLSYLDLNDSCAPMLLPLPTVTSRADGDSGCD